MATKLYEEDINKYVDWGGDESTNGLPVSGEKIQKFLKESLENKFGFMYYDKDSEGKDTKTGITVSSHNPTNQYLIFADKENFALWAENPDGGANFVLAQFDAPAPATIEVSKTGAYSKTILLSDRDNQEISFNYVVKDKSNSPQAGQSTINISINNNVSGTRTLPTVRVDIPSDPAKGVDYKFNEIGKYLLEGVNTINFTITSLMYNVSTTVTYQYRVLNLSLSSTFGNTQSEFNLYKGISLDEESFTTSIIASGAGTKMLRVFIDGVQTYLIDNHNNQRTLDLFVGTNNPSQYDVVIPFNDEQGAKYSWATTGKHNMQMYFYIQDGADNIIKSQTLYYDFVLVGEGMTNGSYILFQRTYENNAFANIVGEGQDPSILPQGSTISIKSEQYLSFSTDYVVLDTSGYGNSADGSAVIIDIKLYNKSDLSNHVPNPNAKPEFSTQVEIPSGTGSTFTYTAQNHGNKELQIINTANNGETVTIDVNIDESSVQIEKTTQSLELELSALNRSNDEGAEDRATWKYEKMVNSRLVTYQAEFNKVLWNSQNGWIDNCLVLNNGATVTIPMNIFSLYRTGVTFEIDFETENVQDDEAIIMTYGSYEDVKDVNDKIIDRNLTGSGIQIKACKAELQSNGGMNIHTNYKDGARQKIAFIFSYNGQDQTQIQGLDCPYLMYIVVNGILDRVAQFPTNDSCTGTSEDYAQFTIGNTEGKVTTKIHSIRVYSRALTLDECVDNFIVDSDDVRGNYLRNDIYNDGSKTINVNKILSADLHIPVMTIYGNITDSIVQVFNKKSNVPVDILYQDPMYPQFNYFARDAWISNQGTSSMNYPRRNFRPYFNKEADSNTLRGFASNDRYKYETRVWWGLTDADAIARIQSGEQDPDEPFTINGIEYKPLRNKKTLKKKPQTIDYDTAVMFVHSNIKIYSDKSCDKAYQIKKLNKYVNDNPEGEIWVQGAYARYKAKDLFTDRWTLKCDYAESSMTHNAGVGRLWGNVMRDVEIGTEGFTYDVEGNKIMTSKPGATNAQRAMQEYDEAHAGQKITINGVQQDLTFGDIRTSCDGYPIIIINRPRIKNGNQFTEEYGDPVFLGLYNIMTDKGSTPLFGFEDLKDEDGNTLFNAGNDDQRTECWECLQNGSRLAQMNDATTDDTDGSTVEYTPGEANNEDRPIFKTYEARWPDNDDLNDTRTDHLETVIRFVNFCKDAVSVRVGKPGQDKDGYELSDYTQLDDLTAQKWFEDKSILNSLPNKTLYLSVPAMSPKDKTASFYATDSDGKIIYDNNTGKAVWMDMDDAKANLYKEGKLLFYYRQTYASQVTATSTGSMTEIYTKDEQITDDVRIQRIYDVLNSSTPYIYTMEESDDPNEISYEPMNWYPNATDEIRQWYYIDKTFDRTIVTKTINTTTMKDEVYTGRVFTYDGKRMNSKREQIHPDAWVTVYLTKNGNNYTYVDEMGKTVPYASGEEVTIVTGNGLKGVIDKGTSFKGKTKFEYFQDQKYEHFDIWKLAFYYVYLMRFAAVDQVIKNTMMTTEDGKHYYFINYDNDTVLGVRNDGYLAYDWQITRETYDESAGSYAFAGFGSVLWNTLEQDPDFLDKVQKAATAMVTSNVLTYDIALDMFNVKQSSTWSERLYNQSEMYKYIGIYNDIDNDGANPYQNTKYLPFLQGSRASHRDWWLRHRFDLYDSKWSAGEYSQNFLHFIMNVEASPSNKQPFLRIVAGSKFYYTIIANNKVLGNNFVELEADQEHTFITNEVLITGNPMMMYGVYKAKVLDFSANRQGLGGSLQCNWAPEKGSLIEELILGGDKPTSEVGACAIQEISNIERLKTLKVLDIRTCSSMKSLDISQLGNLRKFLADGSAINSFIPAKGVMLEEVSLPSSVATLKLNDVSVDEFRFTPSVALTKVEIEDVEGEAFNGSKTVEENGEMIEYVGHNLFEFILNWYIMLKKWGVKMTDYSCSLSFNKMDLMPFYGPENADLTTDVNDWLQDIPKDNPNVSAATKKIKSLDLLNAIKKDFGLNTLGEENFHITKGIIKLCGDNKNGGLTQENYMEMVNLKFNDVKKLWDESAFRSDTAFHFDSNESVFLTVTPYESDKQPVYDSKTEEYTVIAGQKVKITTTIFPVANDRKIKMIPYYYNKVNQPKSWDVVNENTYQYNYDNGLLQSYLTNSNGTAILDIAEYTDTSSKMVEVNIINTTENNSPVATVKINIENMVKPTSNEIEFKNEDGNPVWGEQSINEIKEYKYTLSFTTTKTINVDIDSVEGSFYANTVENNNEYGQISVEYDDEIGAYVLTYLPIIQNDNSPISLYVFVHLGDRQHTILTSQIDLLLNTKKIEDIQLLYNGEALKENEEEELTIEQYVKNTSEIKTVGTRKVVTYNYQIQIDPQNYNVPVKSMEIVVPEDLLVRYNIVKHNSIINPQIIESIDIELPVDKTSMYQFGEFDVVIKDMYDNEVSKKVNVILGYFLPDGINFVKTITTKVGDTNITEFDTSDNSENTILLSQVMPTIKYYLHTYSKIGNIKYIWGNSENITNKYSDESIQFLSSEQYPNATYNGLSDDTFTAIDGIDDLRNDIDGNRFKIESTSNSFSFVLSIGTQGELISDSSNFKYSVSFNGVEAKLDKDIHVERTAALATNFNIDSSDIHAFGEKDTNNVAYTAEQCLYFLDKNLNLYDLNGYNKQTRKVTDVQSYFIALVYVYIDGKGKRTYTSLDPWKLASTREAYRWWRTDSTWFINNDDGRNFKNQAAFHALLSPSGTYAEDPAHYEQYIANNSEGKLYEKWYDYYRIVCSINPANYKYDGGRFTLHSVGTYDISGKSVKELCDAYRKGDIEFSNNSEVTDENMIFHYINDYRKLGIPNMICKPLTPQDYMNIMNNYNAFATFLNALDPFNQYNLATKLFDIGKYQIDTSDDETPGRYEDMENPFSIYIESYNDFEKSKMFWYYETPNDSTWSLIGSAKENIQISLDLNGSNPDQMVYRINNGNDIDAYAYKMSPDYLTYCLFGPYLSV